MEINDIREIEIFHTIEKIKEINEHIIFHQKSEEPDHFAIRQWQGVKLDLQSQLHEMLSAMDALPQTEAERKGLTEGRPQKHHSISVQIAANIREDNMVKRTGSGPSSGITQKDKVKKPEDDIAPERSVEHKTKSHELRNTKKS